MQLTPNYGLKKPEGTDVVDIEDFNGNADVLDSKVKELEDGVAEAKKSVSDGKTLIAAAITAKKIITAATDTFAKMAENIMKIKTGAGTATQGDVLAGKTFSSDAGEELTGTMADYGGQTLSGAASLDAGNGRVQITVPASGRYTAASKLYATYSAIASLIGLTAPKLWPGITLLGITSDKKSVAGGTYTPGTTQKTLVEAGVVVTSGVFLAGDSNLVAANIKQGKSIFGVSGTLVDYKYLADAQTVFP